ncbi:MAG TPA: hypothetical protein VFE47_12435 [Tepidisphaeraceae bacterium]|jgi:hypothetical protein|nr:hypothetical protein [Tepidisphaeraceae bacterium]
MTKITRVLAAPALACFLAGATLAATAASRPASPPSAPKPAVEMPTIGDARQDFTDGKYTDVIKTVVKITTSREWQAKKENAYELYTMKGEAHLHLKESSLAAASFELAAKAAAEQLVIDKAAVDKAEKQNDSLDAKVTADHAAYGVAHATAYLIKHSVGMYYVPKATANQRVAGGSPEDHIKFDIMNADTRKQAMTAIWTDEKNASAAKFAAASSMDNKSPAMVMDAAAAIPNVRDFDFAANGNDEDTHKMASAIAEHGRDVIQDMLDKYNLRLDIVSSDAESVKMSRAGLPGGGYADRWHKHGLEGKQPAEMQDMVKNADKIGTALKMLTDELVPEAGFFDKPVKDVKHIKDEANKLLKIDPSQSYVTKEAAKKS